MKRIATIVLMLFLLTTTSLSQSQVETASAQDAQKIQITRSGSQPSRKGPTENFTGSVRVTPLFEATGPRHASGASVTFEPGARTAWHSHSHGQMLIVTAGLGRVQRWGDRVEEIRPGDVVWIPPGQKHWHGASPTTAMTHIAIQEPLDGKSADWMEKVSDAQYDAQSSPSQGVNSVNQEPSVAQKLVGDFAPKLAELTDDVLFADVWARPGLSQRDRSLVTVAALIAGGNTEQLTSHLNRAKANGITEAEIAEVITHLAFYAGWPKAMSAVRVAKETFKKEP